MARMDDQGYLARLELQVKMEKTDHLEHPEHLENSDKTGKLDRQAHKVPLDLVVWLELPVRLVKQDQVFQLLSFISFSS